MLPPTSCAKFEVATSNGLEDAFAKKIHVKVTQNAAQYLLCHVTYSGTMFDIATSNDYGGDAFERKYII